MCTLADNLSFEEVCVFVFHFICFVNLKFMFFCRQKVPMEEKKPDTDNEQVYGLSAPWGFVSGLGVKVNGELADLGCLESSNS